MKFLLVSAYPSHEWLTSLVSYANNDTVGRHELCEDPEEADVILFVESGQFDDYLYKTLLQHPYITKYPHKVFMYNEVDRPWLTLPGLYTCMPAGRYDSSRQVAFPYLVTPNRFVPQCVIPPSSTSGTPLLKKETLRGWYLQRPLRAVSLFYVLAELGPRLIAHLNQCRLLEHR